MLRLSMVLAVTTGLTSFLPSRCMAQAPAEPARTTGGLSLGLSGLRSGDGNTLIADVMWVGDEMNDGPGFRLVRQALSPRTHGYAAMIFIGGPPSDSVQWMRLDFGLGYVGQQSDRSLKFYQRHGLGAQLATTIAPWKIGFMRPELNGWAIVGTSARFLGASLGARILDPRNR
ncbi:MAG: hypothetical protein H7305_14230 [Gemmatimonadaceae bacterium]|nr:hypothetical protein [Gemmatimonadaceae bacterium]